jgi:concentrative nucleoside transporter, CNT family
MGQLTGILGIAAILTLAFLLSTNRAAIRPRIVFTGLGMQLLFAVLVLKVGFVREGFVQVSHVVDALIGYAGEGSKFLFGDLGVNKPPYGVLFAFQVLPIVIFIASLFSILFYLGVMQIVIRAMAKLMQRLMGASGAESTCVAAGIFMGQTEAPLTIRPFLGRLTESELFCIMAGGMAHVSGAVMAAYVSIAQVPIQNLLTAVVMTAPGTVMLAKMLVPEDKTPVTMGDVKLEVEKPGINLIDAAARGAGEGLQLALNIGGMLIAFVALIAMVNGMLSYFGVTLQALLGMAFAPVAWLLGVPGKDIQAVGNLLGTRLVLNEFVAFLQLGPIKDQLDPRSFTIASFALCGFANLSSIAIQVGGIGALVPERKSDLARLGLKAVLAGTMANFLSAAIAGMLV